MSPLQDWHPSQTGVLSNYNFSDIISVFPEELTVVLNTDVLQVMFFMNLEMFSKLPEVTQQRSQESKTVKTDWKDLVNHYYITYMLKIY